MQKKKAIARKAGKSHQKLQTDNESGSNFPGSFASAVLLKIGQGTLALQFLLVVDESGGDSGGLQAWSCWEIW